MLLKGLPLPDLTPALPPATPYPVLRAFCINWTRERCHCGQILTDGVLFFARRSDREYVQEFFLSGAFEPIERDVAEALLLEPDIRTQRLLVELDTLLSGDFSDTALHRILLSLDPKIEYILNPAKGIEESEQSREHGWLITWYRGEPDSYEKNRKSARSFLRMLQAYTSEPQRWHDDYKFLTPGTVRSSELWFGSPPEGICDPLDEP